jgi:uncharacterized membrane protein YagU involved in acid resistance
MNISRAVIAGLLATAVMTVLMLVEPILGLPKVAFGQQLSIFLAVAVAYVPMSIALGWAVHFGFGVLLALIYAGTVAKRFSGMPVFAGVLYGSLIFLLSQVVFMPLVGAGVFSRGDVPMIMGAAFGHMGYGAILGAVYGGAGKVGAKAA